MFKPKSSTFTFKFCGIASDAAEWGAPEGAVESAAQFKHEMISLNLSCESLAFLARLQLSVIKQDLIFVEARVFNIDVQVLRGGV